MKTKAFTLIELLIVVAIIAILAAIAVPNFLEAQTRAKVARVKSDLRTTATAIESYWVDNPTGPTDCGNGAVTGEWRPYAPNVGHQFLSDPKANFTLGYEVTTPIAYLTSTTAFKDVFKLRRADIQNAAGLSGRDFYNFGNWNMRGKVSTTTTYAASKENCGLWYMSSAGPDKFTNNRNTAATGDYQEVNSIPYRVSYDPTNGTISVGDIFRSQKYSEGLVQQLVLP
ncbi:MAG: prepilin-type N-terminal cleavage/methylation domain-containing protein [Candidatus Sumerlaeota bacterium]